MGQSTLNLENPNLPKGPYISSMDLTPVETLFQRTGDHRKSYRLGASPSLPCRGHLTEALNEYPIQWPDRSRGFIRLTMAGVGTPASPAREARPGD